MDLKITCPQTVLFFSYNSKSVTFLFRDILLLFHCLFLIDLTRVLEGGLSFLCSSGLTCLPFSEALLSVNIQRKCSNMFTVLVSVYWKFAYLFKLFYISKSSKERDFYKYTLCNQENSIIIYFYKYKFMYNEIPLVGHL